MPLFFCLATRPSTFFFSTSLFLFKYVYLSIASFLSSFVSYCYKFGRALKNTTCKNRSVDIHLLQTTSVVRVAEEVVVLVAPLRCCCIWIISILQVNKKQKKKKSSHPVYFEISQHLCLEVRTIQQNPWFNVFHYCHHPLDTQTL